jgi:threonine 3-dehydrogenase
MKAIFKALAAPGAQYGDVDDVQLQPDQLLVQVLRSSICGSDLPIYRWNSWAPERFKVPSTFGHEFCGVVTDVGAQASDYKKGDFISIESHIYCGNCPQCLTGQKNVCREMKIIGIDGPGGFAEYAAVPARCAWRHSDDTLRDVGSLFEPFGNAVYSVLVEPVMDRTVLVTGCGPQGLFSIAVARASGAKVIVAVESSPFRAELARRMGATAVVDPTRVNVLSEVLSAGKAKDGFDVVCEMSGAQSAIELAFKSVCRGGRITAFGLPSKKIEIDWANDLIFKGVRIHGIVGRQIFETWEIADRLLRSGVVDLRSVITHTFPLREFERGFAVMSAPEHLCGKVVFVP